VSYSGEGLQPLVAGKTFSHAYELELQGYAGLPAGQASLSDLALAVPFAALWLGVAVVKRLAAGGKTP
jgi:hypothetical protein